MLGFAFAVAVLATVQTFTSDKIFWLFSTPYAGVMGPILNHGHYAAFIEVVLPFALYEAVRRERGGLLYAGMAAVMYASVIASTSRAGVARQPPKLWRRRCSCGCAGRQRPRLAHRFSEWPSCSPRLQRWWDGNVSGTGSRGARSHGRPPRISDFFAAHDCGASLVRRGVGRMAYRVSRLRHLDVGSLANQAHSDWLQWTAEGGIPLGVALLTLFGWCVLPAVRSVWGMGVIAFFYTPPWTTLFPGPRWGHGRF